ncbi:hypothetical protein GOP47_0008488 [Adiantum capillus-veneris]|uniref:mitogen-activated protein kinase n=1 Tax=Adiantum capillus-veneris TaxID=13818 RepID=A0A9D4UYP1_ADICA|nr:hypothetical protein GOP47_0008488 [Adiantum capillus-veneris]
MHFSVPSIPPRRGCSNWVVIHRKSLYSMDSGLVRCGWSIPWIRKSLIRLCCCFCFILESKEEAKDCSRDMNSACRKEEGDLILEGNEETMSSTCRKEERKLSPLHGIHIKLIRVQHNRPSATVFTTTNPVEKDIFPAYGEGFRYQIQDVIGKGSYGVVCSAVDMHNGEKVAIKKIHDVFGHISDATRILREIKLLRFLRHPNIVEIKHIILPPSSREFKDIYVVFELMESDLHQVVKANNDLTPEHYRIFLYQLLRALKFIHSANVFHRDLKPRNILANSDCTLKICDFGLARAAFDDAASEVFWTDYVATRWYRAPELCGSFFSKYTPAIDIWSIGCIFGEILTGKPLFPGKNVAHQLDLITNLLGTPPPETISRVRNEKARRYLSTMRKKPGVPFSEKFPGVDPLTTELLKGLLAFNPRDRPTAEQALAHEYFKGLARADCEPTIRPISKMEFDFERRRLTKDNLKELIYQEILEYHPQMLMDYLDGGKTVNFMFPSAVDRFRRQFAYLEGGNGKQGSSPSRVLDRAHASLPRQRVIKSTRDSANVGEEREKPPSLLLSASFSYPPSASQNIYDKSEDQDS